MYGSGIPYVYWYTVLANPTLTPSCALAKGRLNGCYFL